MTIISNSRLRQRIAVILVAFCCLLIVGFWGLELHHTLAEYDRQAERLLDDYQNQALEKKGEEFRDMFHKIYTTTRTISMLPMVREVQGSNRNSSREDVVSKGRFSLDAHRSIQQIYKNLQTQAKVSEIYYVLDGFAPQQGDVPFFMYDDLIADAARSSSTLPHRPEETEAFEYAYFPQQLAWFRSHASRFQYADRLDEIPTRISPPLRTCDNSQYQGNGDGSESDTAGILYTMPVYDLKSGAFKGMIVAITRINVMEAQLLGVPFIPVTRADQARMKTEQWDLPPTAAPFALHNQENGVEIFDRRSDIFRKGLAHVVGKEEGRWAKIDLNLHTGSPWVLHHHLTKAEASRLTNEISAAKQATLIGRIVLLLVLTTLGAWIIWLIHKGRQELMRMAHYDSLTDLPNRRMFFERMEIAMARAKRGDLKVGLYFIDIVGFNAINNTLGQHTGDRLLAAVGTRLTECVRDYDLLTRASRLRQAGQSVARLGGDEFTLLCEDIKSTADLAPLAERITESMRRPFSVGDDEVEISLYIGVAAYPDDAQEEGSLLSSAEDAMQQCRTLGPGYLLYNHRMREQAARMHVLSIGLQMALERNQFSLYYQPKASLRNDQIISFEALLRWHHPELGMISPTEFIPLLERSGRIIEVGEWILEQSCRDLARLDQSGRSELKISVNVSVRQLRKGNFHETVSRVLASSGVKPDRLILEITESMMMDNLQEGRQALENLEALGVRLAIDDFGTGYSSLTYLQTLPLNYLKLDKSLIDGMTNDRARHIVHSVIELARGLKLQTIAEGIETEEQRIELKHMGCDMMQGYLLSKPRPIEEILDWLKTRPN